jgi:phosphoserine aminotransferase
MTESPVDQGAEANRDVGEPATASSGRAFNFSAGPATLPEEVLREAREAVLDYRGTGIGVMELSHRSKPYEEIHFGLMAAIRELLGAGEEWEVLLLQGGASLQFSMLPMNLMTGGRAAYVITGEWGQKAAKEARRHGTVEVAATTEAEQFRRVPRAEEVQVPAGVDYLHFTSNNTIFGTQFHDEPPAGGAPLVADMSSDFLSRPVALERYSLIYAGAQKNLGPAGLTVVLIRRELLAQVPANLPTMLSYRTHADKQSLYNTPPCWSIYVALLCCRWLQAQGGLAAVAAHNEEKARRLYTALDGSDFYTPTAEPASRSRMNVTFRLPDEELEKRFLAGATERQLVGLKGHRSVGGMRASLYNAMPLAGVDALVAWMEELREGAG